jgi:membrane protein implicated in regulation of membrane protease activity
MKMELGLILKLLLLSGAISIGIKYAVPLLSIPATATNALIGVFLPPAVMLAVLLWRNSRRANCT